MNTAVLKLTLTLSLVPILLLTGCNGEKARVKKEYAELFTEYQVSSARERLLEEYIRYAEREGRVDEDKGVNEKGETVDFGLAYEQSSFHSRHMNNIRSEMSELEREHVFLREFDIGKSFEDHLRDQMDEEELRRQAANLYSTDYETFMLKAINYQKTGNIDCTSLELTPLETF